MFHFTPAGPSQALFEVTDTLPFFEGHFPGSPVLPAIAVIEASCDFIQSLEPKPSSGRLTIENAKLSRPITPGMKIRLEARRLETRWEVRWWEAATDTEIVLLRIRFG